MKGLIYLILASLFLFSCGNRMEANSDTADKVAQSHLEDSLLTLVQKQTFNYFWEGAEPNSGMARERIHLDGIYPSNDQHIVTTGGTGFGLLAILVGVERNFISREEGLHHIDKIVNFLSKADRFHGAFPHWINGNTGKVQPFGQKDNGGDLVETAFLMQGLLTARAFFDKSTNAEQELRNKITSLWEAVEWDWYTKGENVLYWHWSPEYAWEMNFPVKGYNECLIMYVLAASSPTHPIDPEVYHQGWARAGAIQEDTTYYQLNTVLDHYPGGDDPVGPLFWAHYSYLALNPKGLADQYADYWKLNKNHALIHYRYCVDNPKSFKGYGENCWGLTSSYSMTGYAGHSPSRDLGVITPTAALSSFPYTPEESMKFLKFLYQPLTDSIVGKYGPYDAFSMEANWLLPRYLAIDQGPIPVMIENYRSGFIWNLFSEVEEVQQGLNKLGFSYEE